MKLLLALDKKVCSSPPIWFMRQAGRYLPEYRAIRAKFPSFVEFCLTPDAAVEVTLQPLRRFDMDGAILFSDILMVPYGLGQDVRFLVGEGPCLGAFDPEILDQPMDLFLARLEPVFETVRRLKSAPLMATKTLIGFAGAPWTVATYMIEGQKSKDHSAVKAKAFQDVGFFDYLMGRLVDYTVAYLGKQIQAGAQVVQLFDSWASALPAPYFERWCLAPAREIATRLKQDHPSIKIIYFPKSCAGMYTMVEDALGGVIDGISIDNTLCLDQALKELPSFVLQGGLDPILLLAGGDALTKETNRLLNFFKGNPYIFNLSHGIVPATPIEHVDMVLSLVKEF